MLRCRQEATCGDVTCCGAALGGGCGERRSFQVAAGELGEVSWESGGDRERCAACKGRGNAALLSLRHLSLTQLLFPACGAALIGIASAAAAPADGGALLKLRLASHPDSRSGVHMACACNGMVSYCSERSRDLTIHRSCGQAGTLTVSPQALQLSAALQCQRPS